MDTFCWLVAALERTPGGCEEMTREQILALAKDMIAHRPEYTKKWMSGYYHIVKLNQTFDEMREIF